MSLTQDGICHKKLMREYVEGGRQCLGIEGSTSVQHNCLQGSLDGRNRAIVIAESLDLNH